MKAKVEYFHFVSEGRGNRYFKVDWENNTCVQVTLQSGVYKKGRPHCTGIYNLAISSFRGSYYWHFGRKTKGNAQLLLTTENQFNIALTKYLLTIRCEQIIIS